MKQFKKKLALLLTTMMLLMGLCGCDNKNAKKDDVPDRVVSCAPNLTEMMYDLEAGELLVGRSDYCDYPMEALELPSVGAIDNPNLETIISLEPDLVIATTFTDEGIDKLNSAGITVLVIKDEQDVEGVYNMITELGKAIGKDDVAKKRIAEMQETIGTVEDKIAGLDKPTVYYVIGYGEYGDYTAGGDTFVGGMLETAGGENVAADISGWNISLEEIIEADPYIIIISDYMKDDFVKAPHYSELTAVKEGRVYTMDINMLERQGYRNAEGILELAKIFYPEEFE